MKSYNFIVNREVSHGNFKFSLVLQQRVNYPCTMGSVKKFMSACIGKNRSLKGHVLTGNECYTINIVYVIVDMVL